MGGYDRASERRRSHCTSHAQARVGDDEVSTSGPSGTPPVVKIGGKGGLESHGSLGASTPASGTRSGTGAPAIGRGPQAPLPCSPRGTAECPPGRPSAHARQSVGGPWARPLSAADAPNGSDRVLRPVTGPWARTRAASGERRLSSAPAYGRCAFRAGMDERLPGRATGREEAGQLARSSCSTTRPGGRGHVSRSPSGSGAPREHRPPGERPAQS